MQMADLNSLTIKSREVQMYMDATPHFLFDSEKPFFPSSLNPAV